ncbi:MAG: sporulation protein YqfD [Sporolactobacillus sp.]
MHIAMFSIGGSIKAEISGRSPEMFLDRCAGRGIRLWAVRRKNKTTLVCRMQLPSLKELKALLKTSDCTIHVIDKRGPVFFMKWLKTRIGLAAGFLLFLAVLLLLSNMVWSIQVTGADPKLESHIRGLLSKEHLYVGAVNLFIPDSGKIESDLSAQLTKVTWIGVSRQGTSYHVDVVQKKYPKKQRASGPRDMIAAKSAIIHRLYIEKGQPIVEDNQYVKKGETLVLGRVGDDKSPHLVSATGKVIGETWYKQQVSLPLTRRLTLYTGRSKTHYRLIIGGFSMPIWGFDSHNYRSEDQYRFSHAVRFLAWTLPISFQTTVHREKKQIIHDLTIEQALPEAQQLANRQLLDQLAPGAEIVSTVIDAQQVDQGVLHVSTHLVVYEDIADYQPISDK